MTGPTEPAVDRETLRALAVAVAMDPRLRVEEGPEGRGWAMDPRAHVLYVDPDDRRTLPREEVLGLVCHEAGHAAITRYPWLVPPHLLQETGIALLLNALDDCRLEAWLAARLPGTVPWIEAYNERLLPKEASLSGRPPFVQYALAVVHTWWHGDPPDGLDPVVVAALQRTGEAREAIVALLPPTEAVEVPDTYPGSRVEKVFVRLGETAPPSGFEATVRTMAARVWQRAWEQIVPVFRELVDLTPPGEAKKAAATLLTANTVRATTAPVGVRPLHRVARGPVDDWEAARREVLPQVDTLASRLAELLRDRSLPRWRSGALTGQRVDLARLMQHQARPDRLDLWQRKSLPDRPDPAFLLALDLSGSMQGAPIHGALRGVVLLAEALERCRIPFEVWGYQDVPIPFKGRHQPLAVARARLATLPLEVVGRRPGGRNRPQHNWDGPVLRTLLARHAATARTPVVLMVSDGAPSGPPGAEGALRDAVSACPPHVHLVGIGLGGSAAAVAEHYPRSVVCSLADFPAVLARSLEESLDAH